MAIASFTLPEEWEEAATEMDVSYAEWCRRMIRAGRRQMGYDYDPDEVPVENKGLKLEEDVREVERDVVQEFLLRNLSTEKYIGSKELVSLIEEDINAAAEKLEDEGKVDGSVSKGGWKLIEAHDG